MKYLLVFAVLFLAIWLWRKGRRDEMREREASRRRAPPAVEPPKDMVRCAHCGLHLPKSEALIGPDGVYCSAAHRQAAGH